jgi:hypothetical protein
MIDSQIGRAAFRLGFYIAFMAAILSWLTEPNTAEHVVSLLTLVMSIIFLIGITILVRLGSHR